MIPVKDNIPTDRLPLVTILLIAGNVGLYCFAPSIHVAHGGLVQLLANGLFLWLFGVSVEDAMSRPRFLAFCLLGALAAVGLQRALAPGSPIATSAASGAIAAAIGGYVVLYPRARIVALVLAVFSFTLIELPAWALLAAWFAAQALLAVASAGEAGAGGVGFVAQLGGFAVGLLTIRAFVQRRKSLPTQPGIPVLR